jgi:hypothetical protein
VHRKNVAFVADESSDQIRFYCDLVGLPLPNTGVLWPPVGEGFLLETSFDFLLRNIQRDLFTHHKLGTSNEQDRQDESSLQLLDAIFGGDPVLETS